MNSRKEVREIFEKYGIKIILEELISWIDSEERGEKYLKELLTNLRFVLTEYEGRYLQEDV